MRFIKDLFLSIVKSLVVAVILSVVAMSLLQRKFPPSYNDTRELIQSAKKVLAANAAMKAEHLNTDAIANANTLISSRENLLKEMKKLDPTMDDQPSAPEAAEKLKMPNLREMNRRDLLIMNTKLDQAEYKIRVLEFEMKQLKDEYKKLKMSGAIPNRR